MTERTTRILKACVALIATAIVLAAVGLAFAWPWLPMRNLTPSALGTYAPLADGGASLLVDYGPDNAPHTWKSNNVRLLLDSRAVTTDLRQAIRDELLRFYAARTLRKLSDDDLPDMLSSDSAQLYQVQTREVDASGGMTDTITTGLRDADGDYQLGFSDPVHNSDIVYDPPLHVPADLAPGLAWESSGRISANLNFTIQSHATQDVPAAMKDEVSNCIRIESTVLLTATTVGRQAYNSTQVSQEWYCAGAGLVESRLYAGADTGAPPLVRTQVLATNYRRYLTDTTELPRARMQAVAQSAVTYTPGWQLARVGRTLSSYDVGESSIPPTWIPTDPPLVLAAASGGDLVAFRVNGDDASVAWRFHAGGAIFSAPAFDPASGHVYFGASDKRLYALDTRGLFLWSFITGDNVATRPLVVSDTVIFGSEDRHVYALDAASGALRWRAATGDAVVSSPARYDPPNGVAMALIGCDDGRVYALGTTDGGQRWVYDTGSPIEAPIEVQDGVVYAASRNQILYALDANGGQLLWSAELGAALRSAPAVSADTGRVYIVDGAYRLNMLQSGNGKRLWRSDGVYAGQPQLIGDDVLVTGIDGRVDLLHPDGERLVSVASWTVSGPGTQRSFGLGPTLGGDSAWLSDDSATLWQLGPDLGSAQLKPAWSVNLLYDAPFNRQPFLVPPVRGADDTSQVTLLGRDGSIYSLNPGSGQAARSGTVADANGAPFTDPVVSGQTLLSVMTNGLYASHLADGTLLWSFSDGGAIFRAPVVASDTVVLLTQDTTHGTAISGRIYALNLADGSVRWQAPLDGFISAGNAVLGDGVVYIGTPPEAFDLASGRRLWQAALQGGALGTGGPALSQSGDTLYVGVINGDGTGGVVALDSASGHERWRANLGRDYLSGFEALWVSGERVIVPTGAGDTAIIALDTQAGSVRWRYQPSTPRYGPITLADSGVGHTAMLWMILQNGHVLALDVETGRLAARFADFELELTTLPSIAQRPYVTADGTRVIVAMDTRLLGLASEDVGRAP